MLVISQHHDVISKMPGKPKLMYWDMVKFFRGQCMEVLQQNY